MEQNNYRSGNTLARITALLLLLTAIFNGLFAIIRIIEFTFFSTNKTGSGYLIFALLLGLLSLGVVLFSYTTPIFFLIWQFRAAKNLLFLNKSAITNSPGWNVGWWFIPFASLVMPFQCINELLNGSRNENALDEKYVADSSSQSLSSWWWFFYLVSGFIGMITAFLSFQIIKNPSLISYLVISMIISHSFSIIAALLVRKIVILIDNFQEESYKLYCERHNTLTPPAPPTFN